MSTAVAVEAKPYWVVVEYKANGSAWVQWGSGVKAEALIEAAELRRILKGSGDTTTRVRVEQTVEGDPRLCAGGGRWS